MYRHSPPRLPNTSFFAEQCLPSPFDTCIPLPLSESRATIKHLTKSQTHGTKRGRSGVSPELSGRKRVRPSVDISSLYPAQVAVLSEAAAILQVSVSELADLPKAFSDRPRRLDSDNRSQATSEAFLPQQQVPIMESIPSQPRSSAQTTKPKAQSGFRSAAIHHPAPDDICDLQSFSLGLIPKQISDCFAGFKSSTSRLTLPADFQGKYLDYAQG